MNNTQQTKGRRLRALFESPKTTLMPFGVLPIHAQMAEKAGFEAFEISGGMSSWWVGGVADVGYLTMTEVVEHAARVARSVDIPVYSDADTGYGAPVNVQRSVREFIYAGIAGIHIEDQKNPKKAGSQAGIELVSDAEAIGRLNAACDARDATDPDFVIVARTDGYGTHSGGLDEAIRRGRLYLEETGVDVIFYEGLHTWDEITTALRETPGRAYSIPNPHTVGPRPSLAQLSKMGQAIDIVPFLLPGVVDSWRLLLDVAEAGEYGPMDEYIASIAKLKGTKYDIGWGDGFGRPSYDDVRRIEEKYLPADQHRTYVTTPD
jgi:methylisocitrate lyase